MWAEPVAVCLVRCGGRDGCTLNFLLGFMRAVILPIVWGIGVIAVVATGFWPDPYLEHVRHIPPPHPYAMSTVLFIVLFLTLHVAALFAILRPKSYKQSWGRALLALLLSVGCFGFAALGSMHSPPAYATYLWWLMTVGVSLLGLFIWSAHCAARSANS
jgi:hypothetical protein